MRLTSNIPVPAVLFLFYFIQAPSIHADSGAHLIMHLATPGTGQHAAAVMPWLLQVFMRSQLNIPESFIQSHNPSSTQRPPSGPCLSPPPLRLGAVSRHLPAGYLVSPLHTIKIFHYSDTAMTGLAQVPWQHILWHKLPWRIYLYQIPSPQPTVSKNPVNRPAVIAKKKKRKQDTIDNLKPLVG